MVTVKINDESPTGKRILKDLHRRHKRIVSFEETGKVPEGYLSGDEFERRCIENVTKFYHDKGLL